MNFLEVFDYYFLVMTLGYCFFVYTFTSKSYKKEGDFKAFKLSKKVSVIVSILSFILFVAARFF